MTQVDSEKDLLIQRLANAIDKLVFYGLPVTDWDKNPMSEDYDSYPMAYEIGDSPSQILSKGEHSVWVVPHAIISEICKIMSDGGSDGLGLEDYL